MELLEIGTEVSLDQDGDVIGVIQSIQIHADDSVTYQVVWWSGRSRETAWLNDGCFRITNGNKKRRIGFREK